MIVLVTGAGVLYIYSGLYNVAATKQHSAPFYWALTTTSSRSIATRAEEIEAPPDLADPDAVRAGLALYLEHCRPCHGAPGVPPEPFGMGMIPIPPNLVSIARERTPEEIFWSIKYGIKMSGMPGWKYQMEEAEMWAVTAFVLEMATLSPTAYSELAAAVEAVPASAVDVRTDAEPVADLTEGDRMEGKTALTQYACTACHIIDGIVGRDIRVGPPLRNLADQRYIAGIVPNTPQNLVRWIRAPQEMDPLSAMPDMGVTADDARDMAAYLYDPD